MTDNIAWGNENPSAPSCYDEHEPGCICINCQIEREDGDYE